MSRRLAFAKREMVGHTDRRTDLVAQMLKGIEVVKVYVWEPPFAERLEELRQKELRGLQVTQPQAFRSAPFPTGRSLPYCIVENSRQLAKCSRPLLSAFASLQRALLWRAVMRASSYVMPSIVTFVTLASFTLLGGELTLARVTMTMTFITAIRFPL